MLCLSGFELHSRWVPLMQRETVIVVTELGQTFSFCLGQFVKTFRRY